MVDQYLVVFTAICNEMEEKNYVIARKTHKHNISHISLFCCGKNSTNAHIAMHYFVLQ